MSFILLVITIYYNRADKVEESVKSLLKAAPVDSTVLLVDDGSTDDTLKELQKFESDSRVNVISNENKGFTKTLVDTIDQYVDVNEHRYLSVFGSGDTCLEDKFEKQLSYLEENQDIAALGTGHSVYSYSSKEIILEEASYYEADKENLFKRVPFTHGTVVYRVAQYLKAGGYHSVLKFSQDKDLYLRLIEHGRIVRYPESLYRQYVFKDSASSNPMKKREQIKYQHVLYLNYTNHEKYLESIARLENEDINDVCLDKLFIDKFKAAQKRLALQGEFELAGQWSEILFSIEGKKKHKLLKLVYNVLERVPLLKKIIPKVFFYARKILR